MYYTYPAVPYIHHAHCSLTALLWFDPLSLNSLYPSGYALPCTTLPTSISILNTSVSLGLTSCSLCAMSYRRRPAMVKAKTRRPERHYQSLPTPTAAYQSLPASATKPNTPSLGNVEARFTLPNITIPYRRRHGPDGMAYCSRSCHALYH